MSVAFKYTSILTILHKLSSFQDRVGEGVGMGGWLNKAMSENSIL